jgi:hypothetical protein
MRRSLNVTLITLACTVALPAGLPAVAAPLASQSTTVSGVTAKAKPLVVTGDRWEFEIVLETHTGDLGDDLLKTSVLVTDNDVRLRPLEWHGDPPGGHHRKGVLVFQAVKPAPATIELQITRPDEGAPRAFRWQLS